MLRTVSYLPNAARPEPLGKPNETLYATRFVGNKLYAVTFRQTDPLYTVDLSNVADPRITGERQIPGFSITCTRCPMACCWASGAMPRRAA